MLESFEMDTSVVGTEAPVEHNNPSSNNVPTPLCDHVRQTVSRYLDQMQGHDVTGLYEIVLSEVEKPLIEAVLEHSGQNQSKASKILGLSRSTLRKKIDSYAIR